MLGITIRIGDIVIPLNTRLVSKRGVAMQIKPNLFITMMKEVLDFFDAAGQRQMLVEIMAHFHEPNPKEP